MLDSGISTYQSSQAIRDFALLAPTTFNDLLNNNNDDVCGDADDDDDDCPTTKIKVGGGKKLKLYSAVEYMQGVSLNLLNATDDTVPEAIRNLYKYYMKTKQTNKVMAMNAMFFCYKKALKQLQFVNDCSIIVSKCFTSVSTRMIPLTRAFCAYKITPSDIFNYMQYVQQPHNFDDEKHRVHCENPYYRYVRQIILQTLKNCLQFEGVSSTKVAVPKVSEQDERLLLDMVVEAEDGKMQEQTSKSSSSSSSSSSNESSNAHLSTTKRRPPTTIAEEKNNNSNNSAPVIINIENVNDGGSGEEEKEEEEERIVRGKRKIDDINSNSSGASSIGAASFSSIVFDSEQVAAINDDRLDNKRSKSETSRNCGDSVLLRDDDDDDLETCASSEYVWKIENESKQQQQQPFLPKQRVSTFYRMVRATQQPMPSTVKLTEIEQQIYDNGSTNDNDNNHGNGDSFAAAAAIGKEGMVIEEEDDNEIDDDGEEGEDEDDDGTEEGEEITSDEEEDNDVLLSVKKNKERDSQRHYHQQQQQQQINEGNLFI